MTDPSASDRLAGELAALGGLRRALEGYFDPTVERRCAGASLATLKRGARELQLIVAVKSGVCVLECWEHGSRGLAGTVESLALARELAAEWLHERSSVEELVARGLTVSGGNWRPQRSV
jgi:hypothetical protein